MSVTASIIDGPINAISVHDADGSGAVLEFRGVIRPLEDGEQLDGIEYEVADATALREIQTICREALEAHGLCHVTLLHSRGFVAVGEASLLVAVQAVHRAEALGAMAEIIDRIKQTVPIWKHPRRVGDTSRLAERTTPSVGAITTPRHALDALLERLSPIGVERVALSKSVGRVLAGPLVADRDSPSISVSSMDGYAIAASDAEAGAPLPVRAEASIGCEPRTNAPRTATTIVTGAPVPNGADAVVPIERLNVRDDKILIHDDFVSQIQPGLFVRQAGENIRRGEQVIPAGTRIHAASVAALAHVGDAFPMVFRKPRVAVIVTGSELEDADSAPDTWRIRDANGPAIAAALHTDRCFKVDLRHRVGDDRGAIACAIRDALRTRCDAIIVTGGVSVGPHDHVPGAILDNGCEVLFHKLRQRPGKPMLAAFTADGQPVFGLPGNPVSVLSTLTTLVLPALRALAGLAPQAKQRGVVVSNPDERSIELWWNRLVNRNGDQTSLLPEHGSGDLVAAARATGLVQVPPRGTGHGPWPYHPWPGAEHA